VSWYLGMDIGAISATAAVLADGEEAAPPAPEGSFRPAGSGPFGALYLNAYRRTHGRPVAAAQEILDEVVAWLGADRVAGVVLTGSGSHVAARPLGAAVVNEFKAIAQGCAAAGLNVRTVLEMGGETSKYLRLEPGEAGYVVADYATNGDCAAGTGGFLDQQAGRLKFAIEDVGPLCLGAERAAQIAGRCSVFAKSDMIHAQQKGYGPAEVMRGLCDAVARNFRAAVVRSHAVAPPVAFIGGVAANAAVVRAAREAFGLDEGAFFVPEAFAHLPAIGAAAAARTSRGAADLSHLGALRAASDTAGAAFPRQEPLRMDNVVLLRDRVAAYEPPAPPEPIDAYLGLDVGSVSTNVVAINDEGQVIMEIYTRTKGRPIEVVSDALREMEAAWGDRLRIRGVGTTGSGRELIGQLVGADTINDEITAHKTGATFVGQTMLDGKVPDTIFEIGGQDSKYIALDDGIVVDFTMNDACAAGTGSFLEERAEELGIAIKDEFAALALASEAPIRLGERCTVFMERDVNSYMQRGAETGDLVAGLAYSVVYNYINRVVRGRRIGQCIFFQGGTAYNDAVAAAFAGICGQEIIVPPHNGVIGAIGSALLARDKMLAVRAGALPAVADGAGAAGGDGEEGPGTYVSDRPAAEREAPASRFRGWDLSRVKYTLREFTCNGCSNRCQIQEFTVEGEKTYWGDKCSDRYRKRTKAARKPVIEDLLSLRERLLLDETDVVPPADDALTIGIPRTMFALQTLPLWRALLSRCGFRLVLSDPTNRRIIQAGQDTVVAEPCFPITVAHGHIRDLLAKEVDYIFLPNFVSLETRWKDLLTHLCPWHQTLPFVARRAPALEPWAYKFLSPRVDLSDGALAAADELVPFLHTLGVDKRTARQALAAGDRAQRRFDDARRAAGAAALATLRRTGETGIVLVGRPYNVHDAGVNLSVGRKLRDVYGVNCVPLDFLDLAGEEFTDINDNMYWGLGQDILAAAKIVGRHPNLHIVYITNFKCGPDSFIKHFVRRASGGKPFLTLQFDGHSNDAGMMTRCEAYLDSKGILRPWRRRERAAVAAR